MDMDVGVGQPRVGSYPNQPKCPHGHGTNPIRRWERLQWPHWGMGWKSSFSNCPSSAHKGCTQEHSHVTTATSHCIRLPKCHPNPLARDRSTLSISCL